MRHEEKYLNILMFIILKWVSLSTLFIHLKDYSHSILSLIDSSLQFIWNDHGSVVLSLMMAVERKKCQQWMFILFNISSSNLRYYSNYLIESPKVQISQLL